MVEMQNVLAWWLNQNATQLKIVTELQNSFWNEIQNEELNYWGHVNRMYLKNTYYNQTLIPKIPAPIKYSFGHGTATVIGLLSNKPEFMCLMR